MKIFNDLSLAEAALRYFKMGYTIRACTAGGKGLAHTKYHRDFESEEEVVAAWKENANYNIAIKGHNCGLVVFDVEKKKELNGIPEYYNIGGNDLTAVAKTAHGGRHYFFLDPQHTCPGVSLAKSKIGIEVLSGPTANHAIVAPSVVDGKKYQWTTDYTPAPLPEVLLSWAKLVGGKNTKSTKIPNEANRKYAEGTRHEGIKSFAAGLRSTVSDFKAFSQQVKDRNDTHCVPPLGDNEVEKIIDWAWTNILDTSDGFDEPSKPTALIPLRSLGQIRAMNLKQPEWYINRLVMSDSLVVIQGPAKALKSTIALQMAVCMATGDDFHHLKVSAPKKVVYTQYELSTVSIEHKLESIVQFMFPTKSEKDTYCPMLDQNLRIQSVCPEDAPHNRKMPYIVPGDASDARWSSYVQQLAEFKPDVVIVDPVRRSYSGDENDSEVVSDVMSRFISLRDSLPCTVIVLHHYGKTARKPGTTPDMNSGRGSSVIADAVDCSIQLVSEQVVSEDNCACTYTQFANVVNRYSWGCDPFTLCLKTPKDDQIRQFSIDVVDNGVIASERAKKSQEDTESEGTLYASWMKSLNEGNRLTKEVMFHNLQSAKLKNVKKRYERLSLQLKEDGYNFSLVGGAHFFKDPSQKEEEDV